MSNPYSCYGQLNMRRLPIGYLWWRREKTRYGWRVYSPEMFMVTNDFGDLVAV